jgi:hypothetical protein
MVGIGMEGRLGEMAGKGKRKEGVGASSHILSYLLKHFDD